MFLLSLPEKRVIFIIVIIIATLLVVFLYVLPFIIRYNDHKNFKKQVYKNLYNLAMEKDYYLINNLPLVSENNLVAKLDHIIFSNKYIYVIADKTYEDILSGKKEDNVWLSYSYSGDKKEINNPILLNEIRCDKFATIKKINRNYIISIVVVNNLAKINDIDSLNKSSSYICHKKDLRNVIKNIEKREVSEFNLDNLDREVKEIAKDIYSRN